MKEKKIKKAWMTPLHQRSWMGLNENADEAVPRRYGDPSEIAQSMLRCAESPVFVKPATRCFKPHFHYSKRILCHFLMLWFRSRHWLAWLKMFTSKLMSNVPKPLGFRLPSRSRKTDRRVKPPYWYFSNEIDQMCDPAFYVNLWHIFRVLNNIKRRRHSNSRWP